MTDLKTLWASQGEALPPLDLTDLQARAARMRRKVGARNAREYLCGVVVFAAFSWVAWRSPDVWMRVACALIMAGTAVVLLEMRRRASVRERPEAWAADCAGAYRRELARQRDALASVALWYLAPFVPGLVVLEAAVTRRSAQHMPFWLALIPTSFSVLIAAATFAGVWWLNRRGAQALQRELDALEPRDRSPS